MPSSDENNKPIQKKERELFALDELEKTLGGIEERPEESSSDWIKERQKELGKKGIFSPEISKATEEEERENDQEERMRHLIFLRIREILASGERNRSEKLKALMSQAPKGMEGVVGEIIRKYSPVMNEPTPAIEPPPKVELQTATIFSGYRPSDERKSDNPYAPVGDAVSGLYSGGGNPPDYAKVRFGTDTSAETVVKRLLGRSDEEEEKRDSYSNF